MADVLHDCVAEVAREAARRAEEIEGACRLPADLADRVIDGGLLRMGLGTARHGHDADPLTSFRATMTLAAADGSTGWLVGTISSFSDLLAVASDPGFVEQVFADRRGFVAGGINGEGVSTPVRGGLRVEGHWRFATGCQLASWLGGLCRDERATGQAATFRFVMVPADRAEVRENWQVAGLRGTGSHDVVMPRQVIPVEWSIPFPVPLDLDLGAAGGQRIGVARGLWPTAFALRRDPTRHRPPGARRDRQLRPGQAPARIDRHPR